MMISEQMNAKLNEQITHELEAARAYLAMACMFDGLGLKALHTRFREQADEENGHAMKILEYVLEVGGRVTLAALAAPRSQYGSVPEAIETALKQEKTVTSQIHALVELADTEKDHATRSFLQWFVDEQVEEVAAMEHMLQIAKLAGENLLQLDAYVRHLGKPVGG